MHGLTYEVTYYFYYDTIGIGLQDTTFLCISSDSGTYVTVDTAYYLPPFYVINQYTRYTYRDTITFPAAGFYSVSWAGCCRSLVITNMANPGSSGFIIKNLLFADSANSSPYFLNPGIIIANIGDTFNYNPLAIDPDGDSLVYSLETPLTSNFPCPPNDTVVSGYTYPPSDPSVPFSINSQTGHITFLPNMQSIPQYMVLVKEYRNGILIGTIERDMPIIVGNFPNQPLIVTDSSNILPYGLRQFNITPGDTFKLIFSGYDPDGMSVNLIAQGDPFHLQNQPATFTLNTTSNSATGLYTWITNSSLERNKPYIITIRTQEQSGNNILEKDYTYVLHVGVFSSLTEQSKKEITLKIFPNPTTSQINITSTFTIDKIEITDVMGRVVYSEKLKVKTCTVRMEREGIYFVSLTSNNQTVTRKSVVEK